MRVQLIAKTVPMHRGALTAEDLLAYCARVSNPKSQEEGKDPSGLMKYLVRHNHWSPFEMVSLTMEIVTTRDIARQILRHRSFSFQEFSQRYAEVQSEQITREARMQDTANRQNSLPVDDENLQRQWLAIQGFVQGTTEQAYKQALSLGIAKEVARVVLPEGMTESRLYMAGTLRSWIHYVNLRTGNGTQLEHQKIAQDIRSTLLTEFPSLEGVI